MAHATLDHQLVPVLTSTASRDQDDLTVVEQPSLDNVTEIVIETELDLSTVHVYYGLLCHLGSIKMLKKLHM